MGKAFSLAGLIVAGSVVGFVGNAYAGVAARGFVCGVSNGAPSTNAVKADGSQVAVIRWTSTTFSDAGWTQERRCEEVSSRFNTYLQQGQLAFITTGRMNSLPVICTAATNGGPCTGLLYTLKPGQDATSTLRKLLDVRVKANAGPLNETNGRLYVSVDELVNRADGNGSVRSNSSGTGHTNNQGNNALF